MTEPLTRRKLIATGLAAAAGASGLAAAIRLADRYGLIPPDHGGLYGVRETLTYAVQRLFSSQQPLAPEFTPRRISNLLPINGAPPENATYQRHPPRGFADRMRTV